jgi:hypothetical protein
MSDPIDLTQYVQDKDEIARDEPVVPERPQGVPSNEVYARVGDRVLRTAQDGVRRGLTPQDIIREIIAQHDVRLNVGELRLLLASRRIPA